MTDAQTSKWVRPKLGRVPAGFEGSCDCKLVGHPGPYRAQVVDSETGEIKEVYLCLHKAAAWAFERGVTFPPGPWPKDRDEPGKPPKAFRIPPGTPVAYCRSCSAPIHWIVTDAGKRMPVDQDGTSHFATCPNASQHRR